MNVYFMLFSVVYVWLRRKRRRSDPGTSVRHLGLGIVIP